MFEPGSIFPIYNYSLTQHRWAWIRKTAIYNFRSRRFGRPIPDAPVRLALFNRISSCRDYPIYHNFYSLFILRLQKINEYYIHHWNDFFMNSYSEILIFSLHQTTVIKNTTQGVFHASCPVIPYPIIINLRQSLPEKSPIFGFGSRFPETVFLFFIINFKALLQFSSHQWQTITLTLLIYNRQWTWFELRFENRNEMI